MSVLGTFVPVGAATRSRRATDEINRTNVRISILVYRSRRFEAVEKQVISTVPWTNYPLERHMSRNMRKELEESQCALGKYSTPGRSIQPGRLGFYLTEISRGGQ